MNNKEFSTAAIHCPYKIDFPLWPIWDENEKIKLLSALESGNWAGSRASQLQKFSESFATFHDTKYGVPLVNGTVTLETALIALGIGEGDEVIVPAISFVATASAVLRVNATPIIVDVDPGSLCIDPFRAEEAITDKTRAIIAVHVSGVMCDLDLLTTLCTRNNIALIEDCAHAHGSAWNGRSAGSHGKFGSFSFQHSKLLSAGEGGLLVSNDASLIEKAWNYANCGREKGKDVYFHSTLGTNYRMTEWQGAILSAQLTRYPDQLATRERAAIFLDQAISNIKGLTPQSRDKRMTRQGHYCYVFHVDETLFGKEGRNMFFAALSEAGVPLSLSYPPINDLELFRNASFSPTIRKHLNIDRFKTPNAQKVSANTIWIHHRALLSNTQTLTMLVELIEQTARSLMNKNN